MALANQQIEPLGIVSPIGDKTLQANGADLRVESVEKFAQAGDVMAQGVALPATHAPGNALHEDEVEPYWFLTPGCYLVTLKETISLPSDVMAYLHPRSSLLRCGVTLETAVWDAGYKGRGQVLLVVHNPYGFCLSPGARIGQMTFHRLEQPTVETYSGSYQGENLSK